MSSSCFVSPPILSSHLGLVFISIFFFLLIRRPPRSTLFPYTNALPISLSARTGQRRLLLDRTTGEDAHRARRLCRSEEHTSELQSLRHLVCRLLLEKKKKKIT